MTSFKKIHEMIELHNNVDLKNVIESDKKFTPNSCVGKKSYLHSAIYCDNFEAFQMLINHQKFDAKSVMNKSWIEHALKRYSVGSKYENTRYLEEIIKNNIMLNSSYIRFCPNLNTLQKIINNIDLSVPQGIIKDILNHGVNDDIQLFILESLLVSKPEIFTKQFVDGNVLGYALTSSKIGLIELLKKYNIDTKTCHGKPSILYIITNGKFSKNLLEYLINENHHYNDNLLDKKWFNFGLYNYGYTNTIPEQLEIIIDNLDDLKHCFDKVTDENCELLNIIMSDLFTGKFGKYGLSYMKNKTDTIKKLVHFLLKLNLQQNAFEKLLWIEKFEGMFIHSDKKTTEYNSVYTTDQREFARTVLIGALTYHQPTEPFKKVIDYAFSAVELANMDKLKETYGYKTKEITVKKGKEKPKVMNL